MTRNQGLLAGLTVIVWASSYLLFFRSNIIRWIKDRPRRRREAAEAARRRAEAQARLADELASKYPLPPTRPPPSAG